MNDTRKLIKLSRYSYAVTIPSEVLRRYGWKEKQKLVISDKGNGRLEIRDARSR